jgi:hypothetical protein
LQSPGSEPVPAFFPGTRSTIDFGRQQGLLIIREPCEQRMEIDGCQPRRSPGDPDSGLLPVMALTANRPSFLRDWLLSAQRDGRGD